MSWEVRVGDCRTLMAEMEDCSVDSIVCDPPYELNFMNKGWDASGIAYDLEVWRQALRVLKPGGHLLAFSGSRTYHRMTVAIEDAGFEIRDQIMWIYGSGFPKSHDVSKAIDKAAGVEREVVGQAKRAGKETGTYGAMAGDNLITAPATPEAQQWQGWGTALKPAHEPICIARKPLIGTVAANVLAHGTGAINVDACRVNPGEMTKTGGRSRRGSVYADYEADGPFVARDRGRWPANVVHDGSDDVVAAFPNAPGQRGDHAKCRQSPNGIFGRMRPALDHAGRGDIGSAARFFYTAKASQWDRNGGLDGLNDKPSAASEFRPNHAEKAALGEDGNPYGRWSPKKNIHPTVKPTDLMQYLCRLVTPSNGIVLDPFTGSGSTGRAAILEGFSFIGCELSEEYAEIARGRISYVEQHKHKALVRKKPVTPSDATNDLF